MRAPSRRAGEQASRRAAEQQSSRAAAEQQSSRGCGLLGGWRRATRAVRYRAFIDSTHSVRAFSVTTVHGAWHDTTTLSV
jgi:hypothetical protein